MSDNQTSDTDNAHSSHEERPTVKSGVEFAARVIVGVIIMVALGFTWPALANEGNFNFVILWFVTVVTVAAMWLIHTARRPFSWWSIIWAVLGVGVFGSTMWLAEIFIRVSDPVDPNRNLTGSYGFYEKFIETDEVTVGNGLNLVLFLVLPPIFYVLAMAALKLLMAEPAYKLRFGVPLVLPMLVLFFLAALSMLPYAGWSEQVNCTFCIK